MSAFQLKNIPLFATLPEEDATRLAKVMQAQSFEANHTIFWMGDKGTDFFIIQAGTVELFLQDEGGKETHLAELGPGDCFGELSLLDGAPRTATCRALSSLSVLTLARDAFLNFLKAHPDAAIHLLETLGRRQRETLAQLRSVRNANEVIQETVAGGPLWPRIADRIATISASKQFLVFHLVWFTVWIAFNTLGGSMIFDSYPFGFLTVTVSLEAIFLSIFVLVSANRQGERDRIRADIDHQVNLKAHQELLALHRKLDKMTEEIKELRR
ncbi:MAG: DUF1003 domain-containing protein [Verrucomicrobia bacterium]|nr:DUF1003 domain-containing protein [Kiritimatiellia bacterium]MCO6400666.1 DUF1003 domain-containing protein [Verrucomicrobiota bacterium]